MLAEHPDVFTPDRLWIMDRNFPGVPRIAAMLATSTHVLIRVKADVSRRGRCVTSRRRDVGLGVASDPMGYAETSTTGVALALAWWLRASRIV